MSPKSNVGDVRVQLTDLWAIASTHSQDDTAIADAIGDLLHRIRSIICLGQAGEAQIAQAFYHLERGNLRIALYFVKQALDLCAGED